MPLLSSLVRLFRWPNEFWRGLVLNINLWSLVICWDGSSLLCPMWQSSALLPSSSSRDIEIHQTLPTYHHRFAPWRLPLLVCLFVELIAPLSNVPGYSRYYQPTNVCLFIFVFLCLFVCCLLFFLQRQDDPQPHHCLFVCFMIVTLFVSFLFILL